MAVVIYGKDGCGYTKAACDDYAKRNVAYQFVNVQADAETVRTLHAMAAITTWKPSKNTTMRTAKGRGSAASVNHVVSQAPLRYGSRSFLP